MKPPRQLTCTVCPVGCKLDVSEGAEGVTVQGAACARGKAYGAQEYTDPRRTVTTVVRVVNGCRRVCAVKTSAPIPKAKIGECLAAARGVCLTAPVKAGMVVMKGIAGTGVDLVTTAEC